MTTTPHALRSGNLVQSWAGTAAQLAADSWGVASIVGYRGDGLTNSTATDPQTVLAPGEATPVNLINASTSTSATGGIHEISDDVVALQGSGTADAPHLVIYLDTTGVQDVRFTAMLRELDSTTTDQKFAVQYRVGGTGNFTNLAAGAVSNVFNAAGNQTQALNVALPAAANNQALVEIRIITNDAPGSDAMVGIDDINVTSQPLAGDTPGALSIAGASTAEGDAGFTTISFEVSRQGGSDGAVSATWNVGFTGSADAADLGTPLSGIVSFADGDAATKTITIQVAGDTAFETDETFAVALSAPTGGAELANAAATGTILNDDAPPPPPPASAFINEIHYDNSSTDVGEAVEIAGAAGTNLAGWTLQFYNGSNAPGAAVLYRTTALTGVIADQDDGYGTIAVTLPRDGIQNGAFDGVALVDASGRVVQFLSYEGTITAAGGTNGAAAGLTSTDIGVAEEPAPGAGLSLQLNGTGASYDDFTWTSASDDSFGGVNDGQDFIGATADGQVSIRDASVAEGDAGVQQLVFTVRRAGGGAGSASVDYVIALDGTASASDLAPGTQLSGTINFAPGVSSQQIAIGIVGDIVGEANETLSVTLSNPLGPISIVDDAAVGTIVNDDPIALAIYDIQGESHRSAFAGQTVLTQGIVTAVDGNGFYLQDAAGDGNARTSDAVFVFTGGAPAVARGDGVSVRGTVSEFLGGNDSSNLTVTQVNSQALTVTSSGNALPTAILIGAGGVLPPTDTIDDDGFETFDPATDGIDFYESLEGMRVTIEAPLVLAQSNGFGETFVVASGGTGATGVNARGGIAISDGDFNPEKIQLDADSDLFAGYVPGHTQGDRLADVTGIVSYSFNSYEMLVTDAVTVTSDVTLGREITGIDGDEDRLSIATFNLENLDGLDPQAKFDLLAGNIVTNLSAPDIIGVQEIQDANGAAAGGSLSGTVTAQRLIDAIKAIGGPNYVYVEIAPSAANSTGGEPNGNIRNGFLYNADRVDFVEGSEALVPGNGFNGSRSPLAADFVFNGHTVTAINVHFTSRGGSDPLFGSTQPPSNAGDGARIAQAEHVRDYVNELLGSAPDAHVLVLGDFNAFYFEEALEVLEGEGVLTNLYDLLPDEERYSYLFEGNLQGLDNIMVTGGLAGAAQYDAVHINAEQAAGAARATDHDPQLATFLLPVPNRAPTDLVIDDSEIVENAPAGSVVGIVSASDVDGDALAFALVDDAGGLFAIDATGVLTALQSLDFETRSSYEVVARATDGDGATVEGALTIAVTDVNERPVALADAISVDEDATSDNLWSTLLGNDSDPDAGDTRAISAVDGSAALGSLVFDPASQSLRYVADADAFDALAPGETYVDRFTYTVSDAAGLTSTATVEVTVTGLADGVTRYGGFRADRLDGTAGEDTLYGLIGDDVLNGLGGHDRLWGGIGNDTLDGGTGNDRLSGGVGNDELNGGDGNDRLSGDFGNDILTGGDGTDDFAFSYFGGKDVISDFDVAEDRILLANGLDVTRSRVSDTNRDGVLDLSITFELGGSVTLLGVSDINAVAFERTSEPLFTETLF